MRLVLAPSAPDHNLPRAVGPESKLRFAVRWGLVRGSLAAFGNKAFGIDENGNRSTGGVTINNATLVNNAKSGNPIQIQLNDSRPHTVRNTIAFDVDGAAVTDFSAAVDDASIPGMVSGCPHPTLRIST